MKKNIYSYRRSDGTICDLTAMAEYRSKAAVACIAAQQGRRHALQAAIDALRRAGETDILINVLAMNSFHAKEIKGGE